MSLRGAYLPLSPELVAERLADRIASTPDTVRVAIDGAPCALPHQLAQSLVEPLRIRGRPVAHVRAEQFWRDASLRFEYGKQDPDSYLDWLDVAALRREVLEPAVRSGHYLPSLRDPGTNRATRAEPVPAPKGTVLLVSGSLLLGLGLPFDLVVHLSVSAATLSRRTPSELSWTVPAIERYVDEVDPAAQADVVVRVDDLQRPAVAGL
jgi:hypothetical protein